jgi:phage terminase large subunit GpA-like protein
MPPPELESGRVRRRKELPPVASFRRAGSILAHAARLLRPKSPITVSEWAVKHTGYDVDVLPWQTEPMDALGAGGDVDLMGPAQAGKSEIGLAWWGWTIDHSPADFLICQPDKAMMQDFVIRRQEPMVNKTQVLKDALLDKAGADNIFMKRFGGMISSHIWPVAAQFRARPVPRGWLDDYDQIPEDIEGQGSAHGLMASRQTWFEGRSGTFTSSSPAAGAGMVKEGGGIEARVVGGTNERLAPECPHCGERFVIQFDKHLTFDRMGTPEDAAKSAHVVCPSNGCILMPADRLKLLASCKALPQRGFIPENPAAKRRSFAIDGLMNIRSWGELAKQWREAEIAWETRQDESELRAFWNTKGGKNYRSRLAGEKKVETEDLVRRIEPGWKLGTVPPGVKVLVSSVDVQGNRFEVLTTGFGDGLESWLVDRYEIHVLDDGQTLVDPASCPEHWAIITSKVVQRRYPMADDPSVTMPVLTVAVDTHGEKGTTQNAYAWWRSAVALGIKKDRITLVRGGRNTQTFAVSGSWGDAKKDGTGPNKRTGIRLWNVNTGALKAMWDARLRRTVPGPGFVHVPTGFETRWLDELTAEELRGGKWIKLRPRNETLDLVVYAAAAIMRPPYAQSRSDMDWVPLDYRAPVVVRVERAETLPVPAPVLVPLVQAKVPATAPRVRSVPINKFTGRAGGGSFLQRRG